MPLINHINQSSQIFRPNKNRWDIPPTLEFVNANTLEPVTSYNEGDSLTVKYNFAPRGIQLISAGYDYYSNRYYVGGIAVSLVFRNSNGSIISSSGQTDINLATININGTTGQPTSGSWTGYLQFGKIIADLATEGNMTLSLSVFTYTRSASGTYTQIFYNNVEILNDRITVNDTSQFPIPYPSTANTGKYTTGKDPVVADNYAPHLLQTNYREMIVQHILTPSRLTSSMGLTSGAIIKGFGFDWTSAPAPFYKNKGTKIYIFHADRKNFGEYYSDTQITYYSYPDYLAAPVSGESKNLIFGLSNTTEEILSYQRPNPGFSFGYYDYQLNTNLCSTSFTWDGINPICIEACIAPKTSTSILSGMPMRETTGNYVTNPNTGVSAPVFVEYSTSYKTGTGTSNFCGTTPTVRAYAIPAFRFFWD